MLYPFAFRSSLKERPWGGQRLARLYGKPVPNQARIGESWEISDRSGDVSVLANGPWAGQDLRWLLEHHGAEVLGPAASAPARFPLLIKLLDACELLSIQVHPPETIAARLGGEPKTELWYVAHAEPGATLSVGFRRGVTRGEFERRLREGTVADAIHRVPVRAGDALFLPSGRIHALGAGLVIFEIQQNSDTTYRVFDWNRVGTNGQPRALHVEQALASIDFTDFEPELVTAAWTNEEGVATRRLVDHALFSVVERRAADPVSLTWRGGRPAVVGVVTGGLTIEPAAGGERLRREAGDFVLLPAGLKEVRLDLAPGTVMLEAIPGGRGG